MDILRGHFWPTNAPGLKRALILLLALGLLGGCASQLIQP